MFPLHRHSFLCVATLALAMPVLLEAAPDFEKEVAPILEAKCLFCHDATAKKGKFDLSTRDSAFSHASVGDLIALISGPDPEMPKKETPLTAAQVQILTDWIAAGAPWPEDRTLVYNPKRDLNWWSLRPIKEGLPEGTTLSARHPVDFFIEKQLAEKGLKPLGEADPVTLVRRATFDLTGLPPTPGGDRRFSRGGENRFRRRLVRADRPSPRLTRLRRKVCAALARPRTICGDSRLRQRQTEKQCLALSRLRHSQYQRRQTLHPLCAGAGRG